MIKVVHCKKENYDVYIGRPSKWGNPFTHERKIVGTIGHYTRTTLATHIVKTREDAIQAHLDWLRGVKWQEVEPERREWILNNLHMLKDKVLACWCSPLPCHGDNYKLLIDEKLQKKETASETFTKLKMSDSAWNDIICICRQLMKEEPCELNCKQFHDESLLNKVEKD